MTACASKISIRFYTIDGRPRVGGALAELVFFYSEAPSVSLSAEELFAEKTRTPKSHIATIIQTQPPVCDVFRGSPLIAQKAAK